MRHMGDDELKISQDNDLKIAEEWAANNDWFDSSFIESLRAGFNKYGKLTEKQWQALLKIIDKFKMEG